LARRKGKNEGQGRRTRKKGDTEGPGRRARKKGKGEERGRNARMKEKVRSDDRRRYSEGGGKGKSAGRRIGFIHTDPTKTRVLQTVAGTSRAEASWSKEGSSSIH
jgi:hypothetical protein